MAAPSDPSNKPAAGHKKKKRKKKKTGTPRIPNVEIPSLKGLAVTVPMPEPPDSDELLLRFEQLRREHASERARAAGEPVQPGDEILVDFVMYMNGAVMPMCTRADTWLDDNADLFLPGLRAGLAGVAVGDSQAVEVTLPADYPVDELAGADVVLAVAVHAARAVELPPAESPELLRAIGLGPSLDQTMEALADQLLEERAEASRDLARDLAVQTLAERCAVTVPGELIDAEVSQRFDREEGGVLARMGVPAEQIEETRAAWLAAADARAEAEQVVRGALVIRALVQKKGLELKPENVKSYLEGFSEAAGVPVQELRQQLLEDEAATADLYQNLLRLKAVEYIMRHTEVEVEEP